MTRLGIILLCLGIASTARADVTAFTISPAARTMGDLLTFTAVNDLSKHVSSYKWEYKFVSGNCRGRWIDSGIKTSRMQFYARPGTWSVKLTANYLGIFPPPPAVIRKTVTIPAASKFTVVSGLNTDTPFGKPITLRFRIDGADGPCGQHLTGMLAQKKIASKYTLTPPFELLTPAADNWTPDAPDANFKLEGNEILHVKSQQIPRELWDAIPVGRTYYASTQVVQLKYVDACGDSQCLSLGAITLKRVKVSSTHWKIIEARSIVLHGRSLQ